MSKNSMKLMRKISVIRIERDFVNMSCTKNLILYYMRINQFILQSTMHGNI